MGDAAVFYFQGGGRGLWVLWVQGGLCGGRGLLARGGRWGREGCEGEGSVGTSGEGAVGVGLSIKGKESLEEGLGCDVRDSGQRDRFLAGPRFCAIWTWGTRNNLAPELGVRGPQTEPLFPAPSLPREVVDMTFLLPQPPRLTPCPAGVAVVELQPLNPGVLVPFPV